MNKNEILEQGTVITAAETCLTVEVEGVELHVSPRIHRTGCTCCGDHAHIEVSYNRLERDRIEDHGETDPLGLNE